MPKFQRYLKPSGPGWKGGVVGGVLRFESGKKPWSVAFTQGGKVEKELRFRNKKKAVKWRRTYSNETGRTTNRWRFRPLDGNTVEMTVGPSHIVLYDAGLHTDLSKYVWRYDRQGHRVYTTSKILTSADGSNDELREKRNTSGKQVSMTYFVAGADVSSPRRREPVSNNYIDNRRANFISLSGQKTKKVHKEKKVPKKKKKKH